MSTSDTQPDVPVDERTGVSTCSVTDLIEQEGTVPFLGISDGSAASYPAEVGTHGPKYLTDNDPDRSFTDALSILPHPGEGELWADNEFVEAAGPGDSVQVNTSAIRNVHGLDVDALEDRTGMSLAEMVKAADPEPLVPITTHKDIIDRRRLALRTLGFDCKFRWQIASSTYSPGDMRDFFRRKVTACREHDAEDAFGWIRHRDWGGVVHITTIYPSKEYEVGLPDDMDFDVEMDELTVVDADDWSELEDDAESVTVYYGDKIEYDFRGTRKLTAQPVIYIPAVGATVPVPYAGSDMSRKHTTNLMDDAISWHEQILSKLDTLTESVNRNIIRARLVALDVDSLPFTIEEFYEYVGISNETYCEEAAKRARTLANPDVGPTLWNLQLSLKLALLDHYDGSRAGQTFQAYQAVAGELLRHPASQLSLAYEEYELRQDEDGNTEEDEAGLDDQQQTLGESLDDLLDLTGVTETTLGISDAQRVEQRVQQRLPDSVADDTDGSSDSNSDN